MRDDSANFVKSFCSLLKVLANATIPIVKTVKASIPITALPQSTKLNNKVAPAKANKATPKAAIPPIPSIRPLKNPEIPFFSPLFLSLIAFAITAPSVP